MAKLEVLDWNKKKTGEVDLDDSVVNGEVRKDVLHTVVRWQLARRRQGTHNTKDRGDVSGGGKKPYKQKGTGNARQGSTRSPLLRGGGVIHGPHPRNYDFSVPRKVRQLGLRSALSYLNKEGRLFVVQDLASKDGKTKELVTRLNKFGLEKAVLLDDTKNEMVSRASQNIKAFCYHNVDGLNVYDLLKYDAVVMSQASIDRVEKKCGVHK